MICFNFFSPAWQNPWQKQLKWRRFYFGSWFQRITDHHGTNSSFSLSVVARLWGSCLFILGQAGNRAQDSKQPWIVAQCAQCSDLLCPAKSYLLKFLQPCIIAPSAVDQMFKYEHVKNISHSNSDTITSDWFIYLLAFVKSFVICYLIQTLVAVLERSFSLSDRWVSQSTKIFSSLPVFLQLVSDTHFVIASKWQCLDLNVGMFCLCPEFAICSCATLRLTCYLKDFSLLSTL